jgi:hypothetical protein
MQIVITVRRLGAEESTHMGTEKFDRIDIDTKARTLSLFPADHNKMHYIASFDEFVRISITEEVAPDEQPTNG